MLQPAKGCRGSRPAHGGCVAGAGRQAASGTRGAAAAHARAGGRERAAWPPAPHRWALLGRARQAPRPPLPHQPPRQQRHQQQAEAVHVGGQPTPLPHELLWRSIQPAEPGGGAHARAQGLGEAQVGQAGAAVGREQHVPAGQPACVCLWGVGCGVKGVGGPAGGRWGHCRCSASKVWLNATELAKAGRQTGTQAGRQRQPGARNRAQRSQLTPA